MSEYFFWRYRLKLAQSGAANARTAGSELEGALLRHRDGGHACLQPWPSLGQGDLDSALSRLKEGEQGGSGSNHPAEELLASCRRCIELDGAARASGESLFSGKSVPESHLSVPGRANFHWLEEKFSAGFSIFKLKCGNDLPYEARRVNEFCERFGGGLKLRLDFNESLDLAGIREFIELLGTNLEQIDFIEDPLPYDAATWAQIAADFPVDLAVDAAVGNAEDDFTVRVFKPAWGAIKKTARPAVITSAMDHPLGQLFAAYEASVYQGDLAACGLLTHWLFEADDFSEALGVEGQRLVPPGGSGLGFDELLDQLPWESL